MSGVAIGLLVVLGVVLGALCGYLLAGRSSDHDQQERSGRPESPSGFGPLTEALDRIEHGIVVMDGSGAVVFRNSVALHLSVARHSRALVEDCVQRLLEQARRGRSCSESVELYGPPAELYFVSAHPFGDDRGTGAMALVEDRSEIKRTETVRRDFVANISHELKTPIGALGLLAETIEGEADPEVMRRLAGRMVTESERAARTIDDLLDLSRIEFADDIEFTDVAVEELVSEAVARIATAAEQSGIAVVSDVPAGSRVHGDSRQLVSALFNLLENAVKYSAEGTEVQVLVRGEHRDPGGRADVRISVIDHGIGIPRAALERVFERFYRVDRARSRHTGGTGLGLAIVRHVVSNHGGEVTVESTEGRGSVFTMVLPPGAGTDPSGGTARSGGRDQIEPHDPEPHDTAPHDTAPHDTAPHDTETPQPWTYS